jgi:hypothetical protein
MVFIDKMKLRDAQRRLRRTVRGVDQTRPPEGLMANQQHEGVAAALTDELADGDLLRAWVTLPCISAGG